MAKKLQSDASTWDVCLNQTIAAIRFQKNESTKFSPFFLLYNRDPVLPIDNLLKPRRKYVGEDPHKILLEQQHKSFILVHRNLKKSKEKQKQNADKNRQEINLEIGDPVYFKNHLRKSKLDTKWKPYYRIIEKTSPVTFVLKNQLDGGSTFIQENVVFHKVNEITTTRSNWLVTFVIDLAPFENFVNQLSKDIAQSFILAQRATLFYSKPGYEMYFRTLNNLKEEYRWLTGMYETILSGLQEYDKLQHRTKRSVLPFVGRIMSFLFGTVSDEDLRTINSNIRVLANNQKRISHVLSESLTIVNVTRAEVAQNRKTINSLTTGLHDVDLKLRNITTLLKKEIADLETFVDIYAKLDVITSEMKLMVQRATFYFVHLNSQLNMLSLGHLSPSTINPTSFRFLLTEIQSQLPAYLKLPKDPIKDLWAYYQSLTCTTLIYERKIFVVISVPLLDYNNKFEVFKVFNLPIPMQSNKTNVNMVAKFNLESDYIAVNAERSKYILFDQNEIIQCTHPLVPYCAVSSPTYPINLTPCVPTNCPANYGWLNDQTSSSKCYFDRGGQELIWSNGQKINQGNNHRDQMNNKRKEDNDIGESCINIEFETFNNPATRNVLEWENEDCDDEERFICEFPRIHGRMFNSNRAGVLYIY
ncbi:unnamed protein product [Mytilus edulis]|uniref:Uncharacterized protein n=1 Tax=Mytilus edulis TaxID=6550 RepID=A0A8S3RWC4_MYTED|nr:unnamed protein product [Mytilus edulis]